MNVGFKEITLSYDYNCFIFHDIDILPENKENIYDCVDNPRLLMSSATATRDNKLSDNEKRVRVVAFSKEQFIRLNGFSNEHLNLESHFIYRVKKANLTVKRLPLDVGRYMDLSKPPLSEESLKHSKLGEPGNITDGLSNVTYKTSMHDLRPLYTRIIIGPDGETDKTVHPKAFVGISDGHEPADGFFDYVVAKGVPIKKLDQDKYRISYGNWSCTVDTSIAKAFEKKCMSWTDIFETRLSVLSERTPFSKDKLRKMMGVLPKDGTPITLVARQGNSSLIEGNVIIRLNVHDPLDLKTSMTAHWEGFVNSVVAWARKQPNQEVIKWWNGPHYKGLWNISQPMIVPELAWDDKNLTYYRGPLFFMRAFYDTHESHFSDCKPVDGIGLGTLTKIAHLKGEITTLGFSGNMSDSYNTAFHNRFVLLTHKLPWSYYVYEELTDTS